jgi:GntP family gluconate:H+ symporter
MALAGEITGWDVLPSTVNSMIGNAVGTGVRGVMPAVVRIITAGILAGILIQTGAAEVISATIVRLFGAKLALLAIALSTLILCAVGVFIDVAVITVAPIAITVAKQVKLPTLAILLAMTGGGKAGNIISPNPNTIITSSNLDIPLFNLMLAGIPAMLVGFSVAVLLAMYIAKRAGVDSSLQDSQDLKTQEELDDETSTEQHKRLPKLWAALVAPITVVLLLALNPILANTVRNASATTIDPLIALPIGGILGCICMGKLKELNKYMAYGLSKMMPLAVLFVGTGAIAGVIQDSNLSTDILKMFQSMNLSLVWLAGLAGILMSAASASTTAGANIASGSFRTVLADGSIVFVDGSVSNLSAGAMIHTGATTLDHLPHGTFFHATGGSVYLDIKKRLRLVPYESLVGLSMTIITTIIFGLIIG